MIKFKVPAHGMAVEFSHGFLDSQRERERERERERDILFFVRAQAHRDGYMYICILFFFLCIMRP
jgi:hypothetical protein